MIDRAEKLATNYRLAAASKTEAMKQLAISQKAMKQASAQAEEYKKR